MQLHSVTESLEDSASGKLVEGILASIAEFYPANLGQEIRKGLDQKAAQGGWPGRAPFGYGHVRRDGRGRRGESVLEPDQQAPLVVWAFERYATGELSLASLTEALADKGLRNRLGNPPGVSAIHRMLRNPSTQASFAGGASTETARIRPSSPAICTTRSRARWTHIPPAGSGAGSTIST